MKKKNRVQSVGKEEPEFKVDILTFVFTIIGGLVSWGNIEADGWLDVVAQLIIKYTPPCNNYINDLINIVQDMNLNNGILNSLDVKLDHAKNALEDAKKNDNLNALNKIESLKKEVIAQTGKMISEEQAALLMDKVNMIIDCLN